MIHLVRVRNEGEPGAPFGRAGPFLRKSRCRRGPPAEGRPGGGCLRQAHVRPVPAAEGRSRPGRPGRLGSPPACVRRSSPGTHRCVHRLNRCAWERADAYRQWATGNNRQHDECLRRTVFAAALPVVFVTSSGASMAAPVLRMPSAGRCQLLERKSLDDPALERRGRGRRPGRGNLADAGLRGAGCRRWRSPSRRKAPWGFSRTIIPTGNR